MDRRPATGSSLLQRVAPLLAVALIGFLAWKLVSVLLVLFGAIVIAVLLRALSDPITKRTPLPASASLGIVGVVIIALVAGAGWLFGLQITAQANDIVGRIPAAWNGIHGWLSASPAGRYVLQNVDPSSMFSAGAVVSRFTSIASNGVSVLTNVLLALVGGVYLAISPKTYVKGTLLLLPAPTRPNMSRALSESGVALRSWLLGQLIAMVLIGVLTGIGLALVHNPSPMALGLFAGLAEFIPIIGPLLGFAPAFLTALSVSPHQLLMTGIVFVVIQQLEGNAIQPFIQRSVVAVPPVVGLFALSALGLLFGMLGLLIAAPLTVVILVWVKALYVRDTLGEKIDPTSSGA